MQFLVGDIIYFSADDGSTGQELWAHNTSSHSTWRVADIRSGSSTRIPRVFKCCVLFSAIPFISLPLMEALVLNCGRTTPPIIPHGKSLDINSGSINGIPTGLHVHRNGSSSAIPSISLPADGSVPAWKCGLTTLPTTQHGEWRTSTAEWGNRSGLQHGDSSSATPFISAGRWVMEMSCGPMTPPTIRHGR